MISYGVQRLDVSLLQRLERCADVARELYEIELKLTRLS